MDVVSLFKYMQESIVSLFQKLKALDQKLKLHYSHTLLVVSSLGTYMHETKRGN